MLYNSESNRACNFKSLVRLLPELYSTRSNYYYLGDSGMDYERDKLMLTMFFFQIQDAVLDYTRVIHMRPDISDYHMARVRTHL